MAPTNGEEREDRKELEIEKEKEKKKFIQNMVMDAWVVR
ncbi:hypothetical protein CCACVL1_30018 [Corchorus capsularis]|uniref:Uncharacterized protein n=1 Tax=Corchorus capsularis TaxID=210143 RepID=A0A1R3FZ25_COCAP|nr:hypothetical protein CCACVL1_30018 [Corchorus capsularis]